MRDKTLSQLIEMGAKFVVNHSAGKDSQAMYLHLTRNLDIPLEQIVVIHAVLPGVDWAGSVEHILKNIDDFSYISNIYKLEFYVFTNY